MRHRRGRRKKERIININARVRCFKPCNTPLRMLNYTVINEDELEALRLADYSGMYQEEAADRMNISRTTFARILKRAREKVVKALINGEAILIGGTKHDNSYSDEQW